MHYDHHKMVDMLADRFFAPDRGPIPTRFEDDPEDRAERPHEKFNPKNWRGYSKKQATPRPLAAQA